MPWPRALEDSGLDSSCDARASTSGVMDLSAPEIRVLGCLSRSSGRRPTQYPLTLNALRLACNQSTNRDPVVDYDEATIRDALERLGRRRWARLASGAAAARPSTATCSTRRSASTRRRARRAGAC